MIGNKIYSILFYVPPLNTGTWIPGIPEIIMHRIIVYIDTVTPASALMFKNFFEISVTNLF